MRGRKLGQRGVELDALPPDYLRDLVRDRIERHISESELRNLRVADAPEREALAMFAYEARE
jgi:hypothetical protein